LIVQQGVLTEIGDVDVDPAVIVKVAKAGAGTAAGIACAGAFGDIFEGQEGRP